MDDCASNCVVLRSLFGSCLYDINKNMPLWHYGILLPEKEEDCSLSYLLNLTIDELKKYWSYVDLSLLIIIMLSVLETLLVMEATLVRVLFRARVPGLPGPYQAPFVFTQILTIL